MPNDIKYFWYSITNARKTYETYMPNHEKGKKAGLECKEGQKSMAKSPNNYDPKAKRGAGFADLIPG